MKRWAATLLFVALIARFMAVLLSPDVDFVTYQDDRPVIVVSGG